MNKYRKFLILDTNCETIVEEETRKNILGFLDDYVENFGYDWFDTSLDSFHILYKDGSYDCIDSCYDDHKIKRQNIESMVYTNPETDCVYGNFEMNEYGIVTASFEEKISDINIAEVG